MAFLPDLFGNEALKKQLAAAVSQRSLLHAYIVEGPRGSGRYTLALSLAAALSCESVSGDMPCGVCPHCRRILSGNTPDVQVLSRGNEATLKIEAVRAMRRDIYMAPTENEYKVYIVRDADAMTVQAQNALLKVFEEPPPSVKIFLLCEHADALLTTIRSRAQILRMQRFGESELMAYLKKAAPELLPSDPLELTLALRQASGAIGAAKEALLPEAREALQKKRAYTDAVLAALAAPQPIALYRALFSLPQKRAELAELLLLILSGIRDLLAVKKAEEPPLLYYVEPEAAHAQSRALSATSLSHLYDALLSAVADIESNVNVNSLLLSLFGEMKDGRKG